MSMGISGQRRDRLHSENVDVTFADWRAKGVELIQEPETMPFGRSFMAKDPDGHYLTIYCMAPILSQK